MARRAKDAPTTALAPVASFHPFASIFPLMAGDEFEAMVEDIKENGLREPILEIDNQILDGRNRYNACLRAGVQPRFAQFKGDDPLSAVISANLHRRHLNETSRAMIAAQMANLRDGQRADRLAARSANSQDQVVIRPVTQPEAAKLMHVSARSVSDARRVIDKGAPALVERVRRGEVPVSVAAKIVELPKAQQDEIAMLPEKELTGAVKRASRDRREETLAEATQVASVSLGKELYSVIMADPPWRFEPYSRVTGMDRAADNHYPTMTIDQLLAMRPPAAENCILFLWATPPMLPEALDVMKAWGFKYRTHCIWSKDRVSTGYWFRQCHELLLIGVKGEIPAPAPGDQYASVIGEKVLEHSVKPETFYEIVEDMFPSARPLEMFARRPREGWAAWGNEAPSSNPVESAAAD